MDKKNKRNIKVYGMSGYKYKTTPTIMLKGDWLSKLGFQIGDYLTVSCEDGKIVITPDAERAALEKAEQEFMAREMENLKKKFERERAQLHVQFVAENCPEYGVGREA